WRSRFLHPVTERAMTTSHRSTADCHRTSPSLLRISLLALCLLQAIAGSGNANAAPGDEPTRFTAATASAQDAGPDAARAKGIAPQPFRYLWLPASSFVPLTNPANYSYSGSGCINKAGPGEARFAHKLLLPHGRVIKFIRLYAY